MENDATRNKVQQIFDYLRELNKIKSPPIANIENYVWKLTVSELPKYPSIQFSNFKNSSNIDGVILQVKRQKETSCPSPPAGIVDWLETGWEKLVDHTGYLELRNVADDKGLTTTIKFEDDSERVLQLEKWRKERSDWLAGERPAREANKIYAELFSLQGTLDRESEKYQLYITDGMFVFDSEFGRIHHPILLKKVDLVFNPEIPEFKIYDSDDEAELYSALLRFHQLNGDAISECKSRIKEYEVHPTDEEKTDEFFRYFISRFFRDGTFVDISNEKDRKTSPYIFRNPTFILGTKSQGFADAIERLAEAIPNMEELPEALLRIIGIDVKSQASSEVDGLNEATTRMGKVDFLLTKPTNREQERVIEKLETTGSVLVQGPPGTGKSHTIANIVGHLLANGKKVIVSSHTSKALRVVREKVVNELRPLCVSVLDNDLESKDQLADSINKIVNYHSKTDIATLESEILQLSKVREALKNKIDALQTDALQVRKNEYDDILISGEGVNPSVAARFVKENESLLSLIPTPIVGSSPFPLRNEELIELYASNATISREEESILDGELPDVDAILKPSELKELSERIRLFDQENLTVGKQFWLNGEQDLDGLVHVRELISSAREIFEVEGWLHHCVESAFHASDEVGNPWAIFSAQIVEIHKRIKEHEATESLHLPELSDLHTLEVGKEILSHLKAGGNLSSFTLLFKQSWKKFISTAKVLDGEPHSVSHFQSIVSHLEIRSLRKELLIRWERQVVSAGGSPLSGQYPERSAFSYSEWINRALAWKDTWTNASQPLIALGFDFKKFMDQIKQVNPGKTSLEQIRMGLDSLEQITDSRTNWVKHKLLQNKLEVTLIHLKKTNVSGPGKSLIFGLTDSVSLLDIGSYETYFAVLLELIGKKGVFTKRRELLGKLDHVAPAWASLVRSRSQPHHLSSPPDSLFSAWKVRRLHDSLEERHRSDYVKLQEDISRAKKELEQVTAQYVEKLAWRHQKLNTSHHSWQALQGWLQVQKRITKTGKGKRDAAFLRESRSLIRDARTAVPVWIMPISKISENFDLASTRFDVLILDEASQSDISSLIAFAIARQVIVVGDNEQVTPYAVGLELDKVQSLIEEFLKGIPNSVLYDGKTSIYDLAQQSFGETIRLVEHFRCVPDIISFSNNLSYNGEIKPLREASSSPYTHHTVAHRVQGIRGDGKTNFEEANEIASIIAAMTSSPEYDLNDEGKKTSIGVISLLGDEQAYLIESILKEHLIESVYKERNILCGNSAQFQGDERDVVFLSLVDSSDATVLRLRQAEDFKKIYNVAASRARNQLWVVHSLNPDTDLQSEDLRLRLIRHAENPKNFANLIDEANRLAESPFEKLVQADLIREGYKVTPQWRVGAYRIDMVVSGNKRKIAIECDGETYHPAEALQDDLYRQAVLERLGWQFVRIRGSEYYRDPHMCMMRIFKKLEAMGIEKMYQQEDKVDTDLPNLSKEALLLKAFAIREEWKIKRSNKVA